MGSLVLCRSTRARSTRRPRGAGARERHRRALAHELHERAHRRREELALEHDDRYELAAREVARHQRRRQQRDLIAGGEKLHNACLAADLVNELVLDVAPVLEDEGFKLVLPKGQYRTLSLVETKPLGGGVMQLRYDLRKR